MKKFLAAFMTAVLVLSIGGCTNDKNNSEIVSNYDISQSVENHETNDSFPVHSPEKSDGKTLVVYYSATGTTETIANFIVEITDADIFEIEPEIEYTSKDLDWRDDTSRVSREHDNHENRAVKLKAVTPDNFEGHDTIFIGYPIWWGIAAWPVDSFIKGNDFTGKTVIPFCTAASSDIGESGNLLSDMAGTGEWLDGKRFYSTSLEEEVSSWIDMVT